MTVTVTASYRLRIDVAIIVWNRSRLLLRGSSDFDRYAARARRVHASTTCHTRFSPEHWFFCRFFVIYFYYVSLIITRGRDSKDTSEIASGGFTMSTVTLTETNGRLFRNATFFSTAVPTDLNNNNKSYRISSLVPAIYYWSRDCNVCSTNYSTSRKRSRMSVYCMKFRMCSTTTREDDKMWRNHDMNWIGISYFIFVITHL